ncbi:MULTISPECIES: DUF2987 domain-containing protein [unclassified Pseudoalteromonas]|uniref:DUF2987 domain-containing protein n=1 Tax=unclassified Pseudoalteromonas TaxID=194690 RepID=UPI000F64CCB6|nr:MULTISPECIES: DUF2987 domain-containing protein [unclassified Pseudoalteromonas]RRS07739.1 DUF2987 domain-containing protein [Pseudoalteromonas sp. J010]RXF04750.1 DUF2987 domain-containing protein [Pseudoalteromonas sp. PS5]
MKKLLMLGTAASLLCNSVFAAERSVEYGEINKILDLIANKAQSQYILSKFTVEVKQPELKLEEVKLWLEHDGKVIANGIIDKDGNIDLPILPQPRADEVNLVINQEKDAVAIMVNTDIAPLTRQQVKYRDLFILLEDMDAFVELMAGSLSWLAPNFDELEFTFSEPASIQFVDAKGKTQQFMTDDEFKIQIPNKKKWMQQNPSLQFSVLPKQFAPID